MKPLLNKICFEKLGTYWECELLDETDENSLNKLAKTIENLADKFEKDYSRFLDTSIVSSLNRTKKILSPSDELIKLLEMSREFFYETGGIFNITVGATLARSGYGKLSSREKICDDYDKSISFNSHEVRLSEDAMIDFGGIGKGFLIDKIVEEIKNCGYKNFIVNGGGDLFVNSKQPVKIMLEDPRDNSSSCGQTFIKTGALAASSTLKRKWKNENEDFHHIIDPRLKSSASSDVIADFVKADSATVADVMATVLIIDPSLEEKLRPKYNLKTILIRN